VSFTEVGTFSVLCLAISSGLEQSLLSETTIYIVHWEHEEGVYNIGLVKDHILVEND
jgi:hypothetical protein